MVVLDATAGNRLMWPCKNPPLTVFMDKEMELHRPPDIFAVWQYLPFRDNIFELIFFDPPNLITRGIFNPWYADPKSAGGASGSWYGFFTSKIHLTTSIVGAAKEFYRVGRRLCVKWFEDRVTVWQLLPLLRPWVEVARFNPKPRMGRRSWRHTSSKTFWIILTRS